MKENTLSAQSVSQIENIVREAGKLLLEYWPGNTQSARALAARKKGDGSTVTDADFASNEFLVDSLKLLFPDDGFFSEELGASKGLSDADAVWVIDPLDGTWSFSKGKSEFSILVARVIKQKSVFGMVYLPATEDLYFGQVGLGAFRNGQKTTVSTQDFIRDGGLYTRNFTLLDDCFGHSESVSTCFGVRELCIGAFDGSIIRLKKHREWDLAAYVALVEASGGRVSDENGKEITFHFQDPSYQYFVCSNGLVHEKVLNLLPTET